MTAVDNVSKRAEQATIRSKSQCPCVAASNWIDAESRAKELFALTERCRIELKRATKGWIEGAQVGRGVKSLAEGLKGCRRRN